MPYISKEDRERLVDQDGELDIDSIASAGELNFAITHLLISYLNNHNTKYQTINDIMGALEGAKQEFYRRTVVPYENQKIKENGDIY